MACGSCGKLHQGDPGYSLQTRCFCRSGGFTTVQEAGGGIIGSLVGCIDSLRDLKTQLGARTYEVRLVWTAWTGGERGAGEEYVVREVLLSPTPRIGDLSEVEKQAFEVGVEEEGKVAVSEVSARYSEAELLGWVDDRPIPKDQNFYWEIASGLSERPIRRRFAVASAPNRDALGFQWRIVLMRANSDRGPAGYLELPEGNP